jgi:hypothetical protein
VSSPGSPSSIPTAAATDEARLADAGLADDGQELRRALGHDPRERGAQHPDLALAPDQRLVEPAADRRRVRIDALQQEPAVGERGGVRGVTYDLPGRSGQADLAARAGARQPLGDRHRLADDRAGVGRTGRGHDLAGADARARPAAERQLLHPRAELHCSPEGALRVVLVRHRDAEHGQDRVAAPLDDAALVALADRERRVVEAADHRPQRFGVGAGRLLGAGQLGEDARHPAAGVGRDRRALARGLGLGNLVAEDRGLQRAQRR